MKAKRVRLSIIDYTRHGHIRLPDGRWAISSGPGKYYPESVRDNLLDVRVLALHWTGQSAQSIIHRIDKVLDQMGQLSKSDPHDYLA